MAARPIGMNLITGSAGSVAEPGPMAIPKAVERVLLDRGSERRRNATAGNLVIDGSRVTGVELRVEGGSEPPSAEAVVSTTPSLLHRTASRRPHGGREGRRACWR